MKLLDLTKFVALAITAFPAILHAGPVSTNQTFAVKNDSTFSNTSLDAYAGKILVVMLMTPWCPSCQSNASAVGDGVLDYFNNATRGVLRGKNQHGIEIDSILLSTEPASNWDNTNKSFATTNGYEQSGLDANHLRANPRVLLGYYRGGYPNGVNSSNLYDWGEDRRRVVIINMVNNSASHAYREIMLNQNSFDYDDALSAQTLINSITPAPTVKQFSQWVSGYTFPAGLSGAMSDPDKDGISNLLEFFHGTHPLLANTNHPGPKLVRDGAQWKFVYQRARNIGGFSLEHMSSESLTGWEPLSSALPQTVRDLGEVDEVAITLPNTSKPSMYYQLSVTLSQ